MAFYGFTSLPHPTDPVQSTNGILNKWLVNQGEFCNSGQKIARVEVAEKMYDLVICFPALVLEIYVPDHTSVQADAHLLKWAADGEDIPYGKPYFRLEPNGD